MHSPQVVILVVYGLLDNHANRRIILKQMLPMIMTHACDLSLFGRYFRRLSDEQVYTNTPQ